MEEELSDNELEERFYSILYYGDDTQANVNTTQDVLSLVENAPRSTVRRYWTSGGDDTPNQAIPQNNPYQKINNHKEPQNVNKTADKSDETKPKEEKRVSPLPNLPAHLSIFQSTVPENVKKTVEIIENDPEYINVVELESSDEDEVVEVALPPKPTITIDSSDDEDVIVTEKAPPNKNQALRNTQPPTTVEREVSASPVPSVVSSLSDEFIRGDCIALNISSRHPDHQSFDFSLHGADLLGQSTPSAKKKRKKNKEDANTTIIAQSTPNKTLREECFATPKSKAKNKKQKTKTRTGKSVPNIDIHESDSNQSVIDIDKSSNPYTVTEKSLPSADVYESDSNQSEIVKEASKSKASENNGVDSSDITISLDKTIETTPRNNKRSYSALDVISEIVDLTDNSASYETIDIEENIFIGNVSGFAEDYEDAPMPKKDVTTLGSTKVPAILYEDLDFDNLKGKDKVCKSRKYSLTTLRAEMEKFYNESWGGENFNHREIQKSMSRDKSLWAIDPKDRVQTYARKKQTCNYCNRAGHRDDMCRLKPPVCFMCGRAGHAEPRCPTKICVNCGSPNHLYSTMCRNCAHWGRVTCAECGQPGHPATHCPDLWRRYHNTTEITTNLEMNLYTKKHFQMYCSGCTRRGHMVHACRSTIPFSGLPVNSPYVSIYRPIYTPLPDNYQQNFTRQPRKSVSQDSTISSATTPSRNDRQKRQSNSPTVHETHLNKKRNTSASDTDVSRNTKSPIANAPERKSQGAEQNENSQLSKESDKNTNDVVSATSAPDFIPIGTSNRDKEGQIIQDNEVSDTSDVVTSARIYVTSAILDKLKTKEGEDWLKVITEALDMSVQQSDDQSFLSIKGKVEDREAFQAALRDWSKPKSHKDNAKSDTNVDNVQESESEHSFATNNIPKNRNNVLRKLNKALDALKGDLGEPKAIYQELNYLQNKHQQLLKHKVINPKQVSNNRDHINEMLKKLNMVLLGQAGLADGPQHLSELYSLQEKLINFRQKNISLQLRQQIGEHFHSIFTSIPRDDYVDLLKSYYGSRPTIFKMKNKEKSFKLSPKKKTFNTIPFQQNRLPGRDAWGGGDVKHGYPHKKPIVEKTINKLVFYHRRLLNSHPNNNANKKARLQLARKLHTHIASLRRHENVSSKSLKKMRKIQEHAQMFLNNV